MKLETSVNIQYCYVIFLHIHIGYSHLFILSISTTPALNPLNFSDHTKSQPCIIPIFVIPYEFKIRIFQNLKLASGVATGGMAALSQIASPPLKILYRKNLIFGINTDLVLPPSFKAFPSFVPLVENFWRRQIMF